MPGFFDRGRRKRFAAARKRINPAAASQKRIGAKPLNRGPIPSDGTLGVNGGYEFETALKGAACAFLNSYFAFGTFVGI